MELEKRDNAEFVQLFTVLYHRLFDKYYAQLKTGELELLEIITRKDRYYEEAENEFEEMQKEAQYEKMLDIPSDEEFAKRLSKYCVIEILIRFKKEGRLNLYYGLEEHTFERMYTVSSKGMQNYKIQFTVQKIEQNLYRKLFFPESKSKVRAVTVDSLLPYLTNMKTERDINWGTEAKEEDVILKGNWILNRAWRLKFFNTCYFFGTERPKKTEYVHLVSISYINKTTEKKGKPIYLCAETEDALNIRFGFEVENNEEVKARIESNFKEYLEGLESLSSGRNIKIPVEVENAISSIVRASVNKSIQIVSNFARDLKAIKNEEEHIKIMAKFFKTYIRSLTGLVKEQQHNTILKCSTILLTCYTEIFETYRAERIQQVFDRVFAKLKEENPDINLKSLDPIVEIIKKLFTHT